MAFSVLLLQGYVQLTIYGKILLRQLFGGKDMVRPARGRGGGDFARPRRSHSK